MFKRSYSPYKKVVFKISFEKCLMVSVFQIEKLLFGKEKIKGL
jgi:hypothetical protein